MTVLDADFAKNLTARARSAFLANRRVAVMGGAAVGATLIALMFLWSRDPDYSVLYAGLSGAQGGRAIAELQKLNIPYKISEGGRVILVPTGELGQARLQLAARGVPKTDSDAWGLLDNEALGVSPFIEQVHYVRGLETNLSHTVGELEGVLSAQVTLALPKRTGFLADEPKPSASVLLRMAPGARMSGAQVAGVVGLIASAVPGLDRENVTVVDQDGKVLSTKSGEGLAEIPTQLALVEQINTRYARLIDDLLSPVVGQGNFRVSVDTDIDFAQSKQSLVRYGQTHILSQDQTIHEGGESGAPTGVPGALSNRPPDNPTTQPTPAETQANAAKENAKTSAPRESHAVTNYDIDKTVQSIQDAPWKMQGVSVAVLLNNPSGSPIPAARIKSIKTLVESVIGTGAHHQVTVIDLPFTKPVPPAVVPLTWWKETWIQAIAQNAALAIAGLLALFGGLFPLLRWLRARSGMALQAVAAAAAAAGSGAARGESGASAGPRTAANALESSLDFSGVTGDVFNIDVDAVRRIVANDPGRTAQVIKEWISRGISGSQR